MKILFVEDDDDDFLLAERAMKEAGLTADIVRVKDGEAFMDYLFHRGAFARDASPLPSLIFLDLNLPKKGGHEALTEMKSYPQLSKIPVLVLSTSRSEGDVQAAYQMGANSFIRKPDSYQEMVSLMTTLKRYWIETVLLPKV